MAEVKWIKIVTDVFDDEKTLMIETLPDADSIIVIWFKLLCLAGKQNNSGVFLMGRMPYTDEMFATVFRRPLNTVRLALKTFEDFGMIEIINDTVTIPNWEKHQSIDRLDELREQNRLRVAKHREKQKQLSCNVTVTERNALDKNREDKTREEKTNSIYDSPKRFTKPSLDEVSAYCSERGNNVDAEKWYDYYESNGWKVGKNPMKDWKAAVRTWEKREDYKPKGETKSVVPRYGNFDINEAFAAALQRTYEEET
jgi:predicted phage replisome organizer